jgi:hypothetical protein
MGSTGGAGKASTAKHQAAGNWWEYYRLQDVLGKARQQTTGAFAPSIQAATEFGQGIDLIGTNVAAGKRAADVGARDVRSSLAARGGGGIAGALQGGARARVGAELGGLMQGQSAELNKQLTRANLLNQAITSRQNFLNQLMGMQVGAQGNLGNVVSSTVSGAFGHDLGMAKLQWEQQQKMMEQFGKTGGGDFLSSFLGLKGAGGPMGGGLGNLFGLFGGGGSAAATLPGFLIGGFPCWVAEELFGKHDLRTAHARLWASTHDNRFTRLYRKHGRKWARWVRKSRIFRTIAWPVWRYMAYLGKRQAKRGIPHFQGVNDG